MDEFASELLQKNWEGLWTEGLRKARASGTIKTRRNCGKHAAIWQALISLLLKLSDFKRDGNLGHTMLSYGSRERDNALHALQGGRHTIGQMNQCGTHQPSSRTCVHKKCSPDTLPMQDVWTYAQKRFHVRSLKKITSEIPESWCEVLLCVLPCCKVSTNLTLAWSPFNMATKKRDVHG